MEQDDKVSAAALSLSPASSPGGNGRASLRQNDDAHSARADVAHGESRFEGSARGDGDDTSDPVEARGSARERDSGGAEPKAAGTGKSKTPKVANNVRKIRIERMMSKAELARRANLSVLTIDRVERGYGCRMDTKRKILEALGLSLADRVRVFGEEE
jgi:ribosome-binding protein aMBF1 (putative translation factor)